jgi:hypothetical protein
MFVKRVNLKQISPESLSKPLKTHNEDAPRKTRDSLSSLDRSSHHSQTLPAMSYNPYPFGLKLPTGAVLSVFS